MDTTNTVQELESQKDPSPSVLGLLWVHPRELFVPFSVNMTTFGRGEECSVVLPGERISRMHAAVRRLGPIHVMTDSGSRNGTFRNGETISESPLELNDVIRIGDWIGIVTELSSSDFASGKHFDLIDEGMLVGPRTRDQWRRIESLAQHRVPILIEGPTGSGKEVFARRIHNLSGRSGPFVGINCAALPESLVEAQLFGHVRGAYTGASQSADGLIAAADGGTLLFDEIVDLPPSQQAKLLRVIEEGKVLRIGETTARSVNVRFLAACQQPLWQLVERGKFRADLLGRLSGATLRLAPLRQRREEIPRLFSRYFAEAGGNPRRLKSSAVEALCLAPWPLNIRQLLQVARVVASSIPGDSEIGRTSLREFLLEQSQSAANGTEPRPSNAMVETRSKPVDASPLGKRRALWLTRHQDDLTTLTEALRSTRGNVSEAARQIGMSRSLAVRLLRARDELEQEPPEGS